MCPEGLDIRKDLPRYKVFRYGVLEKEIDNINDLWHHEFVTFLLGCSFSFEEELENNGYFCRHI